MPVYNAQNWVAPAIHSILSQTHTGFELLVIDDHSTDGTEEILRGLKDSRIRYIRHANNLGVARTLNRGIEEARGEYIARMDSDDISRPRRLEVQWERMKRTPRLGAVGSWIRLIGKYKQVVRLPWGTDRVRVSLGFDNPLCHPSVMLRRSLLVQTGLRYDPSFGRSEDFDLWVRMSQHADLDNIPMVLLDYRVHDSSVTATALGAMQEQTLRLLRRAQEQQGYERFNAEEMAFHYCVAHASGVQSLEQMARADAWLQGLCGMNQRRGLSSSQAFEWVASRAWFWFCANNARLGYRTWLQWKGSPLIKSGYCPSLAERIRFAGAAAWWQLHPPQYRTVRARQIPS